MVWVNSVNICILIFPYPWVLLGSSFLIILLTCSTEKLVDLKIDSSGAVNLAGNQILFDKRHALPCKIWIIKLKLTLCLNFIYTFVIMVYWSHTRHIFTIQCFWKVPILFRIETFIRKLKWCILVIFPFSLIIFFVNEILNISKMKLKIIIAFTIGCVLHFIKFLFFYQTMEALCHQNLLLIWNKIAHDM